MHLEWDEAKRRSNLEKHALDFRDARRILEGDLVEIPDDPRDHDEERVRAYGLLEGRAVLVVYAPLGEDSYRIISMRKATTNEERLLLDRLGY